MKNEVREKLARSCLLLESIGTNRVETFVNKFTIIESAGREKYFFWSRNKGGLFPRSRKLKLWTGERNFAGERRVRN